MRFSTAWRRSERSISIAGMVSSVATLTVVPCRPASGRTNSVTARTMSLTESSSNWAFGKRAKARYSSVSASRALTCSRIDPTRPIASFLCAPGWSCTMSPSNSALSPMAAMGLRTSCATLSDRRPTVAMRSASTSFSWAACSRVSVPETSTLSRSTSLRARRSRPATSPRAYAGSPISSISIITGVQPAQSLASAAAAA